MVRLASAAHGKPAASHLECSAKPILPLHGDLGDFRHVARTVVLNHRPSSTARVSIYSQPVEFKGGDWAPHGMAVFSLRHRARKSIGASQAGFDMIREALNVITTRCPLPASPSLHPSARFPGFPAQ